jgi:hypothetical protein
MDAEQNTPRPTLLQQVQANDEFERQMEARLRPYLNRISENIDRAVRLLQLFEHLCEIEAEGRQDILRAAVVFIHAYLEDFCAPSRASCFRLETGTPFRTDHSQAQAASAEARSSFWDSLRSTGQNG